jgi:hypothetical protein
MGESVKIIDTTFEKNNGKISFKNELEKINKEAENAVRSGYVHIILTDKDFS